jgi:hypothetical protein
MFRKSVKLKSSIDAKLYRRDARESDEEGEEDDDAGEDFSRNAKSAEKVAKLVHQSGYDALKSAHLSI